MKGHKRIDLELEIRPLTALSINNGNTLDQASYVIENGRKCAVIDINRLFKRILNHGSDVQKHALSEALSKTSNGLSELKTFVMNNFKEEEVLYKSSISVFTQSRVMKNGGNLNINEIYREQIDGKAIPVIPGSSLKGAMRTAFTGQASNKEEVFSDEIYEQLKKKIGKLKNSKDFNANNIEAEIDAEVLFSKDFLSRKQYKESFCYEDKDDSKIMRAPQTSAMRSLQIADAMPLKSETEFVSLSVLGKTMSKALPIVDVIKGSLMGSESLFETTLRLSEVKDIRHPLTIDNLINDCNCFAVNTFRKEKEVLISPFKRAYENSSFDSYDELEKIVEIPRRKGEFLLKIGRFSQREYVTYSNNLRYVERTNYTNAKWGNTRTMMYDGSQYLPLGWCLCSLI